MKVLIINCGSSSLKYQLIDSESEAVLAKGLCERIGIDGRLSYEKTGAEKETRDAPMPTHTEAVQLVVDALTNPKTGAIGSLKEIDAIGHRVVHGGEKFAGSALVNDEMLAAVKECIDLAPLHNPANLIGIEVCRKLMPGVPMVGVFDTAFHQTMPRKAYLYAIPIEYYEQYKIRKYGFHGTSHSFVSKELARFLGLKLEDSRIIVCHLGNGASISAVKDGKCVDTSMGLTPLAGLVMDTRSGDLDPSVVDFLGKKLDKDAAGVIDVLNKKSGVLGLSRGLSSDFRDLEEAAEKGNKDAESAFEVFCYRVATTVGAYAAAMNGVDAIAFTAGIGENAAGVRAQIIKYLGYLGIELDAEKNKQRGSNVKISTDSSRVAACVIPTNEEIAICRETVAVLQAK
ncbi:MAG: acetate kinase [Ottowia sp.]|nr:acetate kinase [Ottowia sp.]